MPLARSIGLVDQRIDVETLVAETRGDIHKVLALDMIPHSTPNSLNM